MNNIIENDLSFLLPEELCAHEPPEARGLSRDGVRLLHIDRLSQAVTHSQFKQLPSFLNRSDLIVFNRSRTLPAVLLGHDTDTGTVVELRLAEQLKDDSWLALLICHGRDEENTFKCGLRQGLKLELPGDWQAEVVSRDSRINRLWRLRFNKPYSELIALLFKFGRPVRYEHEFGDLNLIV